MCIKASSMFGYLHLCRDLSGQRLWLSWQSGSFQHQRSAVRIPTSENNLSVNLSIAWFRKDENKRKVAGEACFLKNTLLVLLWKKMRPRFCTLVTFSSKSFGLPQTGNHFGFNKSQARKNSSKREKVLSLKEHFFSLSSRSFFIGLKLWLTTPGKKNFGPPGVRIFRSLKR